MLQKLKFDFAPEWLALLALAVLDVAWARAIGFHLTVSWSDGKLVGLGLLALLLVRLFSERGSMMAEYFSLTAATTLVFAVLSYLSLASSGPLVDASLLAADRALGIDWMAGYHFLMSQPLITLVLKFAYASLVYQGLYFGVLFALMGKKKELRQMFWLVLVMGILTSLGTVLFPALGPFKLFDVVPDASYLPDAERLRSGHDLNFALAHLTGVVTFPSFHTAMALAYIWGFRNTGPIGWGVTLLNLVMLCSIPWMGGHYLVDMIAGAVMMAASLAIVRFASRQAVMPLPQAAPAIG